MYNKHYEKIKYIFKKNAKIIPIVGIIILLSLFLLNNNNSIKYDSDKPFDIIETLFNDFMNLFDFSDINQLLITSILIITIWTGYKYWLVEIRIIKRNIKLVDNLVFTIILLVFSVHINFNSNLGIYFEYGYFFIVLYIILAGTWFFAKAIDSLNLERDLYCWAIRILGGFLMVVGGLLLFTGALATSLDGSIFSNIFWIIGLCIVGLGAFSEYRSFRRYGVFVYMR